MLALLACAYAVLWLGGVTQGWRGGDASGSQGWLAGSFLTLAGLIVIVGARTGSERLALLAVALLGFTVEVLGVRLGVPFGSYSYTDALGPRLLGVPPSVAFAWMTLAAYVKQMIARFNFAPRTEMLVAALWLTALDLVIDPVANQLGYWRWEVEGAFYGIPLTNFAGWLIVSLVFFKILGKKFEPSLPQQLAGLSIILFFTLLALFTSSYFIALLGCLLIVVHVALPGMQRDKRGS